MLKRKICLLFFYAYAAILWAEPNSSSSQQNPDSLQPQKAPVYGFARAFPISYALPNATITILETGEKYKTDANGNFGPIYYPIGKPITLVFKKWGYKTTQSATMTVPKEGLQGPHENISFQVPSSLTFYLYSKIVGARFDENSCHVATTVTALNKTLNDERQGEMGATIKLIPTTNDKPFYFDIFKTGFLKNYTNPFTRTLTQVSADGGAGFFNLPPREQPYIMQAYKNGVKFTEVKFICRKNAFINMSPPQGPKAVWYTNK